MQIKNSVALVTQALGFERHREVLEQLEREFTACREECHHQGGGGTR